MMKSTTPEQFIDNFLQHYSEGYDPAKAKAYYEANKKLKGRKTGSSRSTVSNVGRSNGSTTTVSNVSTSSSVSPAQRAAARAEATKKKVEAIRGKIDKLDAYLNKLRAERRTKDIDTSTKSKSSDSKTKDKAESSKKDSEPAKKLTAAEKAKKAKDAREDYAKEKKNDPAAMSAEELDEKIADVRQRVTELKVRLRETLKDAR